VSQEIPDLEVAVMRRNRSARSVAVLLVTLGVVVSLGGCDWLFPEPAEPTEQTVVGVTTTGDIPYVQLADGRTFELDLLENWEEEEQRFATNAAALAPRSVEPKALPAEVDMRSFQTPIKTQWRGTCVQFAVTAAIEARLRRIYAGELDLSERFGQLIQKMSHLTDELQPQAHCRENQLGAWSGGGVSYQMQWFTRYRLPLESHLPFASISDPGIDWKASRCASGTDQDAMDDYNLSPANLSQVALENARFRADTAVMCPAGSLTDPEWYETAMANGYEVVFGAALCGADPSPGNGVWDPGDGPECAGHAMLMVGYRHDDRVFIVKNSWGYNVEHGESGFTLMSYDWVEDGYVRAAGYFTEADDDTPYPFMEHMLLGRWALNHDGWEGTLDIYRFSDMFSPSALQGETDRRLGTYWGPDGVARRVNGTIDGHEIEFWIDWDTPNLDYGDLQGLYFTGYIFTQDPVMVAGTMVDNRDGQDYPFYATKDALLVGTPAPGPFGASSYLGRWEMNHDGWSGVLEFSELETPQETGPSLAIWGTYTPDGGTAVPVAGQIYTATPREIRFDIQFVGGSQSFHGYILGHDPGILAGTTEWNGTPFGFVARRTGGIP
jgi:hypothetical protein